MLPYLRVSYPGIQLGKQRHARPNLSWGRVTHAVAKGFYPGARNWGKERGSILCRVTRTYVAVVVVQAVTLLAMWLFSRHFGIS